MTDRDTFALHAMPILLNLLSDKNAREEDLVRKAGQEAVMKAIASLSYDMADAMIAERNRRQNS